MADNDSRTGTRYWKLRAQIKHLEDAFQQYRAGDTKQRVETMLRIQELEAELNPLAAKLREAKSTTFTALQESLTPAERRQVNPLKTSARWPVIVGTSIVGVLLLALTLPAFRSVFTQANDRPTSIAAATLALSATASVLAIALVPTATPASTATIAAPTASPTAAPTVATPTVTDRPTITAIDVTALQTQTAAALQSMSTVTVVPPAPTATTALAAPTAAPNASLVRGKLRARENNIPLYTNATGKETNGFADNFRDLELYLCRQEQGRWAIDLPNSLAPCATPRGWIVTIAIEQLP